MGILAPMRRQQLSDHLAGVPLFAACSRGDIKILARHIVEVEVPEGATIVKEGERGDAFYVVIEGEARVASGGSKKGSREVARLGPGGWFGELAVLDPAPRNATVTASTPMVLGVLGSRVFRAVLRDVPSLTEKLLAGMARRLRDADRLLNDLGAQPRKGASRTGAAADERQPHRPRRTGRSAGSRAR
jgi:CRP/FNR family transcriptional regulator, cyclic AMP receptor protein